MASEPLHYEVSIDATDAACGRLLRALANRRATVGRVLALAPALRSTRAVSLFVAVALRPEDAEAFRDEVNPIDMRRVPRVGVSRGE